MPARRLAGSKTRAAHPNAGYACRRSMISTCCCPGRRCTCAARHRSADSSKVIRPVFGSTYCPVTADCEVTSSSHRCASTLRAKCLECSRPVESPYRARHLPRTHKPERLTSILTSPAAFTCGRQVAVHSWRRRLRIQVGEAASSTARCRTATAAVAATMTTAPEPLPGLEPLPDQVAGREPEHRDERQERPGHRRGTRAGR